MANAILPVVLANVVRVDIITEEATPTAITVTTGNTAAFEPIVDEGDRKTLRAKNQILAQNNFEDLVTGYNIKLTDVVLRPDQLALIDGGTVKDNLGLFEYTGPEAGLTVKRKKVTVDIWTEEKDGDGDSLSYVRFRGRHAVGKPVSFSFNDQEFFAPEYSLESKPKISEAPIHIKQYNALPSVDATATELLEG